MADPYVSANLAELPLAKVLGAFTSAVAESAQELTTLYITQLLALAHGVNTDGEFGDDEEKRNIQSVSFTATNAEGKTFELSVPLTSFMPLPTQVQSATCDLTVQVRSVKEDTAQSSFDFSYGKC